MSPDNKKDMAARLALLSEYMDPEDLEHFRTAVKRGKKEAMREMFVGDTIKEFPQEIVASITLYNDSARNEGYPVCRISVGNSDSFFQKVTVGVTMEPGISFEEEFEVPGKDVLEREIRIRGQNNALSMMTGQYSDVNVSVKDCYGREVAYASGDVQIVENSKVSKLSVTVNRLSDANTIAELVLKSEESRPIGCTIATLYNGAIVKEKRVTVGSNEEFVESAAVPIGCKSDNLAVAVYHNGKMIPTKYPESMVKPNPAPAPSAECRPTKRRIYGSCVVPSVIDTHVQKDGFIEIGVAVISNKEPEDQECSIQLVLDGSTVIFEKVTAKSGSRTMCSLKVPAINIQKETTYQARLECRISDSEDGIVYLKPMTTTVRSVYDLDLNRLIERTSKFVNPLLPEIEDFVDNKNSPLYKRVPGLSVSGYQSEDNIIEQLESVWYGLRSMNMSYVSDTETLKAEGAYQRVRTPDKVLADRSGNCLELSILFASIFEAMGFESVIVYPRGHAIPGIVLQSEAFRSKSKYPSSMMNYFVRLKNNEGKRMDLLLIEATLCTNSRCDFENAVASAKNCVSNDKDLQSGKQNFCIVPIEKNKRN